MTVVALTAFVLGLFLAIGWFAGAAILAAADRWRACLAPRWIPAVILAVPLVAMAVTASLALISLEHGSADGAGYDDGGIQVVAHAALGRTDLSRKTLPFTFALSVVLAWRLLQRVRLGWQAMAAERHHDSAMATHRSTGEGIVLLDLGEANARAVAWPGPRILFDANWWGDLNDADRAIVVAHERAHLRRRDPVVAFACCVASAVLPRRAWSRAFARWRCWAEQAADLAAAQSHGDPIPVAELLIRQHRARVPAALHPAPVLRFGEQQALEERVHALAFGSTPASALDPDLDVRSLTGIGLLMAVPLILAPAVHALIESVLRMPH